MLKLEKCEEKCEEKEWAWDMKEFEVGEKC